MTRDQLLAAAAALLALVALAYGMKRDYAGDQREIGANTQRIQDLERRVDRLDQREVYYHGEDNNTRKEH